MQTDNSRAVLLVVSLSLNFTTRRTARELRLTAALDEKSGVHMTDVIELKKGSIYFRAAFFDSELRIPSIETYIYEGLDEEDGYTFISASGFVALETKQKTEDPHYICYPDNDISAILDKKNLIKWLQESHNPQQVAREFVYVEVK